MAERRVYRVAPDDADALRRQVQAAAAEHERSGHSYEAAVRLAILDTVMGDTDE